MDKKALQEFKEHGRIGGKSRWSKITDPEERSRIMRDVARMKKIAKRKSHT